MSSTSLTESEKSFGEAVNDLAETRIPGSANTRRAYAAALRYWSAWFALRYGRPIALPVDPAVVLTFLQDHLPQDPDQEPLRVDPFRTAQQLSQHGLPADIDEILVRRKLKARLGPLPLPTVAARLSALSRAHKLQAPTSANRAPSNPLADPQVREQLKRCRAAAANVPRARRAAIPLTRGNLEALLTTCEDDLAGLRDRALLLLAWHTGGRRRSELAAAQMAQYQSRDGNACFELPRSSNERHRRLPDPQGLATLKPLPAEAAAALHAWTNQLTAQQIAHGALFRAVRGEHIGEPLSGEAIRMILKRRARLAQLDVRSISPASLRSGFVRDAVARHVPLQDVLALAGYRHIPPAL